MSSAQTPARTTSALSSSAAKTYTREEKDKFKMEAKDAKLKLIDMIIELKSKKNDIENDIKELKALKLDAYTDIHRAKVEKIEKRILKLDALKSELTRLLKIAKNSGGGTAKRRRSNSTKKRRSIKNH